MKRKCIALLLVMMTVFAFFCSGALAAERDSISVNGHASAEVTPDMATLYGNLEKRAAVAETARENLAKEMAAFKHVLLGPERMSRRSVTPYSRSSVMKKINADLPVTWPGQIIK